MDKDEAGLYLLLMDCDSMVKDGNEPNLTGRCGGSSLADGGVVTGMKGIDAVDEGEGAVSNCVAESRDAGIVVSSELSPVIVEVGGEEHNAGFLSQETGSMDLFGGGSAVEVVSLEPSLVVVEGKGEGDDRSGSPLNEQAGEKAGDGLEEKKGEELLTHVNVVESLKVVEKRNESEQVLCTIASLQADDIQGSIGVTEPDLPRITHIQNLLEAEIPLLQSPEKRQKHADPKMDPDCESEDDEDKEEKEKHLRLRSSSFNRRERDLISPRKGGLSSNKSWTGTGWSASIPGTAARSSFAAAPLEKSPSIESWNNSGRRDYPDSMCTSVGEREMQQSLGSEKPRSVVVVPQPVGKSMESEKLWYYKDPFGKLQGPFSIAQLCKWNNREEPPMDSILPTDALAGMFQTRTQSVDNSFVKAQVAVCSGQSSQYELVDSHGLGGGGGDAPSFSQSISGTYGTGTQVPSRSSTQAQAPATNLSRGRNTVNHSQNSGLANSGFPQQTRMMLGNNKRDMRHVRKPTPVKMYLDIENIQLSVPDSELVSRVNDALKTYNMHYYLSEIIICGEKRFMNETRASSMTTPECKVEYVEVPKQTLSCDNCHFDFRPVAGEPYSDLVRMREVADRMLVDRFLSYSVEELNAVILVVSTDKDFAWPMSDLVTDRYTVFSACIPEHDEIPRVARRFACTAGWHWREMENRGRFFRG